MKDKDRADALKWIHDWEQAGLVLQRSRRDALDHVDVEQAIEGLDDAFEAALFHSPPRRSSGLVELQSWLARARQ